MSCEEIVIDGRRFRGSSLPTPNGVILLIQGEKANLGCGYFNLAVADKLGDRFAVVTGVKCFNDMLEKAVVGTSSAAAACGVTPGLSGREALLAMEQK